MRAQNLLSNNAISEKYILREQIEKLTPVGKHILDSYERVRVDDRTIILKKRKDE